MSTKDWLEKDYYKVLGVSKNASEADIKKAFRKIARDNHPDAHPGDKQREARFKEAAEASDVLSDPGKRKEYDDARSLFGGGSGGGFRFPKPGSYEDLFSRTRMGDGDEGGFADILGGFFGGGRSRSRGAGPRRGSDVEGETSITFDQAAEGTTVALQLESDQACGACFGTGAKAGTTPKVCPTCQGTGMQTSTSGGVFAVSEPCRDCRGRGMIVDDPCPECAGSGHGRSTRNLTVRIPGGVADGQRIRIKGKGGVGANGGAAGDLYVTVHVAAHPLFGRNGSNLTLIVPITFPEASLGAEIDVPTLQGGSVRLRIPAGTPNGRKFRVPAKGIKQGSSHGDMIVTVEVTVPATIPDAAKEALQAYEQACGPFNPRAKLFDR